MRSEQFTFYINVKTSFFHYLSETEMPEEENVTEGWGKHPVPLSPGTGVDEQDRTHSPVLVEQVTGNCAHVENSGFPVCLVGEEVRQHAVHAELTEEVNTI